MAVFWLMYLTPALASIANLRSRGRGGLAPWLLVGLLFTLLVGLRHEVGGDWIHYLSHYQRTVDVTLLTAIQTSDPGYAFLNWFVARLGGGIYLVNTIAGAVLMSGVIVFARRQPQPWLAMAAAVPYLIIVVGMGYTRQGMALGMAMLGLVALSERRTRRFVVLVLVGALFHKSAVLLLPVAALAATRKKLWSYFWVGVIAGTAAYLLVAEEQEKLWYHYVELQMASEGGAIRVAMNAVPAVLFLVFRRRVAPDETERRLWTIMALLSLAAVPMVTVASTAIDRVSLYLIPMQLFLFPRLFLITRDRALGAAATLLFYAAVQFVWLGFSNHAQYWLPYQFAPFHW